MSGPSEFDWHDPETPTLESRVIAAAEFFAHLPTMEQR